MNKEVGLKPCPFCGGEPEYFTGMGDHWVNCKNRCLDGDLSKEMAQESWNKRVCPKGDHKDKLLREAVK